MLIIILIIIDINNIFKILNKEEKQKYYILIFCYGIFYL
jgi:hypothetical protein